MKIVYWSGSGNTEKMANLIAQGIKENGVEAQAVLFGSYDWGDGEWMRDWMSRMEEYGCDVMFDGLIIHEALEDDCTECLELGKKIAGMLVKSSN